MTSIKRIVFLYLIVYIAICEGQKNDDVQVPAPTIEALWPKGFRMTLKDDGYSFVGFRGNINKEFEELTEGDIKKDIVQANGGLWVYKNREEKLKIGDTVFYWLFIIKNGKGRRHTDLEHTITGFVNDKGMAVSETGEILTGPPTSRDNQSSGTYDPIDTRYDPIASNCTISKTMVQGRSHTCQGSLIFGEEFDKTSLKELKEWDATIQFPGEPDYPFNVYIPDNTVSFEEGSLVITPVLTETQGPEGYLQQALNLGNRCTGQEGTPECKQAASGAQILPPVTTAKITTRRSFNFKFGRVEVRAKLPFGSWLMPEINLEASDNTYGSHNYGSGLMRIAFARGNPGQDKKLYGGPVLSDAEPFRSMLLQEKIGIDNWHNDFHNYTMIWRPDGMDLLVDGEQYGTVNPFGGFFEIAKKNNVGHASLWQKGTVMAPLDEMFHLTLGLCVGGVNDFSDDFEDKPWRNAASKARLDFWNSKESWNPSWYNSALRVDFVRVYAL